MSLIKPSLIKEIQILRQVSHQGVIKLYEVYENENYIYLIKELLKGLKVINFRWGVVQKIEEEYLLL